MSKKLTKLNSKTIDNGHLVRNRRTFASDDDIWAEPVQEKATTQKQEKPRKQNKSKTEKVKKDEKKVKERKQDVTRQEKEDNSGEKLSTKKKVWIVVLVILFLAIFIAAWILIAVAPNGSDGGSANSYLLCVNEDDGSEYYAFKGNSSWKENTEITVPSEYNGKPVTIILSSAFKDYTKVTRINLPETIVEIGDKAFEGCTALVSINDLNFISIPNSVKVIGSAAFRNCKSIERVVWPSRMSSMDSNMFMGCESLEYLYLTSTSMVTCTPSTFDASFKQWIIKIYIPNNDLYAYYWANENWEWANNAHLNLFAIGHP